MAEADSRHAADTPLKPSLGTPPSTYPFSVPSLPSPGHPRRLASGNRALQAGEVVQGTTRMLITSSHSVALRGTGGWEVCELLLMVVVVVMVVSSKQLHVPPSAAMVGEPANSEGRLQRRWCHADPL